MSYLKAVCAHCGEEILHGVLTRLWLHENGATVCKTRPVAKPKPGSIRAN